jgi:tRNA threonylcarbamoyladenosine modification (KEOPS) complex Cgi121 subunit
MEAEHVMVLASSKLSVNDLLAKIPIEDCVQLFDERAIACKEQLEFAYLNAVKIQQRGESKTKSLAMELLLCAAMSSQIGDAIKKAGAKTGKMFVVFSDSKQAYAKLEKFLVDPVEFNPKEVKERIVKLGIKSGNVEDLIQEIALHAMER